MSLNLGWRRGGDLEVEFFPVKFRDLFETCYFVAANRIRLSLRPPGELLCALLFSLLLSLTLLKSCCSTTSHKDLLKGY